jgi:cytochrome c553
MKKCTSCGQVKAKSEFYTKKRSKARKDGTIHHWVGLYAKCKKCHDRITARTRHKYKDWYQNYRDNNKERISKKTKAWYVDVKTEWWKIIATLKELRCERCGYDKHSAAFDFHHTDPTKKESTVHQLINGPRPNEDNIEVLKSEIKKCVLMCSNCHRETHARYNFADIVRKKG